MSAIEPAPKPDLRVRTEPNASRRLLGAINGISANDPAGWLVLACEGQTVLEMRMLPSEIACETAARFDAVMAAACPSRTPARRTPRAVLLDHLVLAARWERMNGKGAMRLDRALSKVARPQKTFDSPE